MSRPEALLESISDNLGHFLQKIDAGLTKPRKKFLRDSLIGLLRAGRPIVCQMARKLPDQGVTFLSRRDRIESHLNNDRDDFDAQIRTTIPSLWVPLVRDDTPIILDMSDLAKPLARTMDYLATVRDGSTGQLVNGYWLVELYASVCHKNPIPILLEPFSHEQPFCPGQNPVLIAAVRQVFQWSAGRGVLVVDRGGDAITLLCDWLDQKYRFVVRLRGDRDLLAFYNSVGGLADTVEFQQDGQWVPIAARDLAERTATSYRWGRVVKCKGRVVLRIGQIGWVRVRLPGRSEVLTMVVSRQAGCETPMMLLTTLTVETVADAKRVLRYYIRRWECEEGIRLLKSGVNLERIRTFHWTAICRLVLLSVLVMLYLTWLVERKPTLTERIIAFGQPLPEEPNFLLYRLLTGLTEAIDACFYLRRDLL